MNKDDQTNHPLTHGEEGAYYTQRSEAKFGRRPTEPLRYQLDEDMCSLVSRFIGHLKTEQDAVKAFKKTLQPFVKSP